MGQRVRQTKNEKRKSSMRLLLRGGAASPEGDTREEKPNKMVLLHAWDGIELLDLLSIRMMKYPA